MHICARACDRTQKFDLGVGVLRKADSTAHEFATVVEAGKVGDILNPNAHVLAHASMPRLEIRKSREI